MIHKNIQTIGQIFQCLFIQLRTLASQEKAQDILFDFADKAEYLGGLIAEPNDKTEIFRRNLITISEDYNCRNVVSIFDGNDERK
jgi:hypothetical protein